MFASRTRSPHAAASLTPDRETRSEASWPRLLPVAVLGVAAVGLPIAGMAGLGPYLERAAAVVAGLGPVGPVLAAILGALLAGVAVLPTFVVSLTAGYVFGLAVGTPVAAAAVAGGTLVNYAVARRLRAGRLSEVVSRSPTARALAGELASRDARRTTLAVTLVRLPPQLPFALVTVIAAGLGVRRVPLVIGTLLGMGPRILLATWFGATLYTWRDEATPPGAVTYALIAGVVGMGGLTVWGWTIVRDLRRRHADASIGSPRGPHDERPRTH